eukprot:7389728-Prymnesium_polylepis.2
MAAAASSSTDRSTSSMVYHLVGSGCGIGNGAAAARQIHSRAQATGEHIFFRAQRSPHTSAEGQRGSHGSARARGGAHLLEQRCGDAKRCGGGDARGLQSLPPRGPKGVSVRRRRWFAPAHESRRRERGAGLARSRVRRWLPAHASRGERAVVGERHAELAQGARGAERVQVVEQQHERLFDGRVEGKHAQQLLLEDDDAPLRRIWRWR